MLSSLNAVISTNESTRIITGHAIYNPAYTYKFQLKTTLAVERGEELVVIQSDFGSGWTYVQGVHGVGFVPTKILYFV